jgi:hypothetical protein
VPELSEFDKDLQLLSAELRKLEGEYTMYFSGRLPRPPWETRGRVEQLIKRWDRKPLDSLMARFRFQMVQSRFTKFVDLWDRSLRAREEGRASPLSARRPEVPDRSPAAAISAAAGPGTVHVATVSDPRTEMDKIHELYGSLMDARRQSGEAVVPFHKFAALVKSQVEKMQASGNQEVAFRVAVKDGKVNFTVRGLKGGGT